jgi:hypothetical protein
MHRLVSTSGAARPRAPHTSAPEVGRQTEDLVGEYLSRRMRDSKSLRKLIQISVDSQLYESTSQRGLEFEIGALIMANGPALERGPWISAGGAATHASSGGNLPVD